MLSYSYHCTDRARPVGGRQASVMGLPADSRLAAGQGEASSQSRIRRILEEPRFVSLLAKGHSRINQPVVHPNNVWYLGFGVDRLQNSHHFTSLQIEAETTAYAFDTAVAPPFTADVESVLDRALRQ